MSTISRTGTAFFIVLLVCVAVVLFWIGRSGTEAQDAVTVDAGETQEQPVGRQADTSGREPTGVRGDGAKEESSDEGAARTRLIEDRTARITGRCVTVKGLPIGDCTVVGKRYQTGAQQRAKKSGGRPESVPPTKTDGDGYFELQYRPAENWSYSLHFSARGHAYYRGELGAVEPGRTRDVGEIVLSAGARVRGRVVDDQGMPVGDCQLGLSINRKQFASLGACVTGGVEFSRV